MSVKEVIDEILEYIGDKVRLVEGDKHPIVTFIILILFILYVLKRSHII